MAAQGGIISAAMELIKEKERQGDKAMDRLHDGFKTQMQLTANQGSWTGDNKPSQVVKEKETVKEKVKEPEEEKPESTPRPLPLRPHLRPMMIRRTRRTLPTWVLSDSHRERNKFNLIHHTTTWAL